jgi:hypothetical protein
MSIRRLTTLVVFMAAVLGTTTAWAQVDVKGSHDHPLVTRMPGFYIDS